MSQPAWWLPDPSFPFQSSCRQGRELVDPLFLWQNLARVVLELCSVRPATYTDPRAASRRVPMTIIFKITDTLTNNVREDLHRPHSFAAERVGFLLCRSTVGNDVLLVLAA